MISLLQTLYKTDADSNLNFRVYGLEILPEDGKIGRLCVETGANVLYDVELESTMVGACKERKRLMIFKLIGLSNR